jgi:hypothetical protein
MFDVKSIRQQGDNYIVTGLFDKEETELHIALGRLQQSQKNDPDAHVIFEIVSQTLIACSSSIELNMPDGSEVSLKAISPDEKLYTTILSIHTPPPKG